MSAWRAVFWGFLGVRKARDLEQDADRLEPWRLILTGLLGTGLLVLTLLGLVGIVTS